MRARILLPSLCFVSALPSLAAANPLTAPKAAAPSNPISVFLGLPNFQLETATPWTSAGNDISDNHFASNEFLLSPYTLPLVTERWVFTANGEVQGTPTVDGTNVYVADAGGTVWQLNAATGSPVWQSSLPAISGNSMSYSRNSPAIGTNAVIVGDQSSSNLYALSKTDGSLVWQTALDSNPDAFVTSSPVISNGVIYVGVASGEETMAAKIANFVPSFRGSVVALSEATGKILWQTYTVPSGYTGGGVWASNLAVDTTRGMVYGVSGDNYSVPPSVAACQLAATTPTQLDACLSPDDHIDSVYALNAATGAFIWSQRFTHSDTWTVSCESFGKNKATPCPDPSGLDTDFGAGPNFFTVNQNGTQIDAVGAGQKSGSYYTMNRDTGAILWGTQAGPDGVIGGIQWGAATDGQRIYFAEANSAYVPTTLVPSGQKTNGSYWSALDVNTGQILWQTPIYSPAVTPQGGRAENPPAGAYTIGGGSVSVANGVLYGEDAAGDFVALDTTNGQIFRSVQSGGASISAPAIVDGALYWASGYASVGQTNNKVYSLWIGIQ